MAEADFGSRGVPLLPEGRRLVPLAGAAGSLALAVFLVWWGYDLAMRDARGVPVVRALEGPARVAPEDPGGAVIEHQGLAVNDVAASGGAAAPPDSLLLAPAPVALAPEDVPGLAGAATPLPEAAGAAAPSSGPAQAAPAGLIDAAEPPPPVEAPAAPADPADLVPVIEGGQDAAVAAALAEALAMDDVPLASADPDATTDATTDAAGTPLPEGALARSPRPLMRPGPGAGEAGAPAAQTAGAPAPPEAVDPATIAAGTRLVQFGAFESPDEAQAEWMRLAARFAPLMAGKRMVIEAAESGGRAFWRLRALGFEDEADSRRFCAAFEAENARCIPVAQR